MKSRRSRQFLKLFEQLPAMYRNKRIRRIGSLPQILIIHLSALKRLMQGNICILSELAEGIGLLDNMRVVELNGFGLEATRTTINSDK